MTRVAWEFNGYAWPVNPNTDSGWSSEEILAESNPVNASRSTLQFGGTKSARRQVSGWLFGLHAQEQFNRMSSWKSSKVRSLLKDHTGSTRAARLIKFDAKPSLSVSEWRSGRNTYEYTAEFIEDV